MFAFLTLSKTVMRPPKPVTVYVIIAWVAKPRGASKFPVFFNTLRAHSQLTIYTILGRYTLDDRVSDGCDTLHGTHT
jgi:hypothetical protein